MRWLCMVCVSLVVGWAWSGNAEAQQAPADDAGEAEASDEGDDEEEGVPVVEQQPGQEGPVIVVEQDPGSVPPGYESQPLQPVPQPGQPVPAPAGDPSYGQQPGYGQQQPGYGQSYERPRYHREPYVEGTQLPPNAQIEERTRKGLLIPGIAMFAAGYVAMVFSYVFAEAFGNPPETMLIPLIGPFFLFPGASSEGRLLLGFDALLQIGGLAMLITGAVAKKKYVVWYGDSGVNVRPLASRRGGGLQLSYTF